MSLLKVQIVERLSDDRRTTLCATSLDFLPGDKFPFENIMDSFRALYPTKNLIFHFTIL